MRMAYDQNGQLIVDRGLGWVPAAPAAPALSGEADCGCGKKKKKGAENGSLGASEKGSTVVPLLLTLGALWGVSALLGGSR